MVVLVNLWRAYDRSCRRKRKAHQAIPYNVEEVGISTPGQYESESSTDSGNSAKESRILLIGHGDKEIEETDSMRVFSSHSAIGNPPPYTPSEVGGQKQVEFKSDKQ